MLIIVPLSQPSERDLHEPSDRLEGGPGLVASVLGDMTCSAPFRGVMSQGLARGSVDHLIRPLRQRRGDRQTEGLGGLGAVVATWPADLTA